MKWSNVKQIFRRNVTDPLRARLAMWKNVKLIFCREVSDQLRDRRMLLMVAVLPLLLYPLLGMGVMQVTQFIEEHPTKVWVVGTGQLPLEPQLVEAVDQNGKEVWRFDNNYFGSAQEVELLQLEVTAATLDPKLLQEQAQEKLAAGEVDAVLYFPPDFGQQLAEYREKMAAQAAGQRLPRLDMFTPSAVLEAEVAEETPAAEPQDTTSDEPTESEPTASEQIAEAEEAPADAATGFAPAVPRPQILWDRSRDKSQIAQNRLGSVLSSWRSSFESETRREVNLPAVTSMPFEVQTHDVADAQGSRSTIWAKILPFVLLIWALTGAFYPAVDLCAGEKERGTLETLLSSPASRSEIVWGKLLTVMTFSAATALLNMFSMGLTGTIILQKFNGYLPLGPPPLFALGWLVLAVIPIAALFSALAMALAAMARSTKEAQYYLMPLLMVTMPLMLIPLLPAAEIDLGKSLIPVSGLMLLLRTLMEGHYMEALRYAVPVLGVTAVCCHFAIRWAVDQFNNESVIFRESERFNLSQWMTHLVRDRTDTPSTAEAAMCGMLLLVIGFFVRMSIPSPAVPSWNFVMISTLVLQIACIATPVVIMAIMLTRSPAKTLLLSAPRWMAVPAAALLALCMHPLVISLSEMLKMLYPIKDEAAYAQFAELFSGAPLWQLLLILAVLPAVCEELAFRGFILSGMRHLGHKWGAIALTSLFFGLAHMAFIQQSISAFMMGLVLGFIAVQSRSILPGMVFHGVHNGVIVSMTSWVPYLKEHFPWYSWVFEETSSLDSLHYSWPLVAVAGVFTIGILFWFRSEPYQPSEEERLQEALDHQGLPAA